nr:MAG TPA: hypothetical protein [Caudoviricetes sp.]
MRKLIKNENNPLLCLEVTDFFVYLQQRFRS